MQGAIPTHPGDVLKDEIKARRLGTARAAKKFGVDQTYLAQVLAAEASMTPALAESLEQHWGIPAHVWLGLQEGYDTHPKNQHGGKRPGAGRKPEGVVTKIVRLTAPSEEMESIMGWLERQPNKARAAANALYKQAKQ
jgi:antitoxin HigA-1